MSNDRTIRVECALPWCFVKFTTSATRPRAYCCTEHSREGGKLNSVAEQRKRREKEAMANKKLAEKYADAPCPGCGGSLDYDEDVVFCTDRDDCGWSRTVGQIVKGRLLPSPSAKPGKDSKKNEDADDHVRVVDEEEEEAPDPAEEPEESVEEEPAEEEEEPGDSVEEVEHVKPKRTPHELDVIARRLSSYDPRTIEKVCKAAILIRQAVDMLSSAKGEII